MVQVCDIKIGEGRPKICASITETDRKSIIAAADILIQKGIDIVEWRMDFYKDIENWMDVQETLLRLKMSLCGKPLLVTFRTKKEGGQRELSTEKYRELLDHIAETGCAQMSDVEVFQSFLYEDLCKMEFETVREEWELFQQWIQKLQKKMVVVGSYHNFDRTPDDEELETRYRFMKDSGVDIIKMAVMPLNKMDVLRLMMFTEKKVEGTQIPMITMAMGSLGSVSRVVGEAFGSSVTFGSIGQCSAPGQIPVNRLGEMLDGIHLFY